MSPVSHVLAGGFFTIKPPGNPKEKQQNDRGNKKGNKMHRGILNSSACLIFQKGIVSARMPVLLGLMNIYTDIYIPSLYNFAYMNSSIIEQSQSSNYQNN